MQWRYAGMKERAPKLDEIEASTQPPLLLAELLRAQRPDAGTTISKYVSYE